MEIHENDQPEHLGADLEELLAEDPRVSEQGLQVTAEDSVVLVEGTVGTQERRDAVTEVLAERLAGWRIDNRLTVLAAEMDAPGPAEHLP